MNTYDCRGPARRPGLLAQMGAHETILLLSAGSQKKRKRRATLGSGDSECGPVESQRRAQESALSLSANSFAYSTRGKIECSTRAAISAASLAGRQ